MVHILLVDDDPNSQEVISDILHYHGMQVDAVESGEMALEYLEQQPYDTVIIDLRLPGMNGWELLRSVHNKSDARCVAITVYDNPTVEAETQKAGFDAYFAKPLDEMSFGNAIRELLG